MLARNSSRSLQKAPNSYPSPQLGAFTHKLDRGADNPPVQPPPKSRTSRVSAFGHAAESATHLDWTIMRTRHYFSVLLSSLVPFVACGGSSSGVGATCDLDDDSSCSAGLQCSETADGGAVCALAPGADCSPTGAEQRGDCAEDAVCAVPAGADDEQTICLSTEGGRCDPDEPYCEAALTCAETTDGDHRCFAPVVMIGDVTDTSTADEISAAHVIALDEEGSAVTDVAVTGADGTYELEVPVVRDEDGAPVDTTFTLQGSAQGYQPFPQGVRVALPISTEEAELVEERYVIENALTAIGLISLPEAQRFTVAGQVTGLTMESNVGGALVVASGEAGTFSAVTDLSGAFTLFNMLDGDYTITVYASGLQVETTNVTVEGEDVADVVLTQLEEETTTVTGSVQIVEGGGATSVILVVEDTFDPLVARGEVPRGLRAPRSGPPSITGEFTIEGVPQGRYVVLAAYENDNLVRDPDMNIAGTDIVHITVDGESATFDISDSFKVTQALATVSPGVDGPEAVTEAPLLQWGDDSSEDWYDVRVFDAFGEEVWTALEVPSVSGGDVASVQYEGPLEPGMYYQFRVTSWRQPGGGDASPIATTEDLRGVFFLP